MDENLSYIWCFLIQLSYYPTNNRKSQSFQKGICTQRNEKAVSLHAPGYRFRIYHTSSAATASSHFSMYTFCTTAAVQL